MCLCPCFTAGVGVEFPQVNLSNSRYPNCLSQAQMTLFCPCEEAQLVRALCVCGGGEMGVHAYMSKSEEQTSKRPPACAHFPTAV